MKFKILLLGICLMLLTTIGYAYGRQYKITIIVGGRSVYSTNISEEEYNTYWKTVVDNSLKNQYYIEGNPFRIRTTIEIRPPSY